MRKLRNSLFIWVSLSFMLGILLYQALGTGVLYALIPAPTLFFILLIFNKKVSPTWSDWGIRLSAVLSFVLLGGLAILWRSSVPSDHISHLIGKRVEVTGVALTDSRQSLYGQRIWVEARSVNPDEGGDSIPVSGKMVLYINQKEHAPVKAHQKIKCRVKVKELTGKNEGYLNYLRRKGITCAGSTWKVDSLGTERSMAWKLGQSRNWFTRRIEKSVEDPDAAALAEAMLLGDKRNLDKEVKEHFASAGISHLLAVSGLHVGLIYLLLQFLMSFLPPGKHTAKLKGGLVLGILVIYALLTGAGPAVNRAVIMLGFILVGRIWFQRVKILNIVALTAFVLLVVNPKMLFDVGFQLSFSAVAGIILLTPPISRFFKDRIPILPVKVTEAIGVSIAAQLATAPLVIIYFGQFPTYFLLSNLILLPIATVAVWAGFIGLIFGWVPFLSDLALFIMEGLLKIITFLSETIAGLPGAVINKWNFSDPGFCILLIMTIGILTLLYIRKLWNWIQKLLKPNSENS